MCDVDYCTHSKIQSAVENEDLEYILQTIETLDPETIKKDPLHWTPLHHAVSLGKLSVVEAILQQKPDTINTEDKHQRTPLTLAVAKGHVGITDCFLQNGADVNLGLVVCYAALKGNVDCIQKLVDSGADVNEIDSTREKEKRTPLINAVANNNSDVVKFLISQGADVNFGANEQMTALHYACLNGYLDCVKELVEARAELYSVDKHDMHPFDYAVSYEREEIVAYLLEKGYDVNTEDPVLHQTPLHLAAVSGNLALVTEMINHGASVNAQNIDEDTALSSTLSFIKSANKDIIKLLLDNEANVTLTNKSKWTPLHLCTLAGDAECVKLLLEKNNSTEVVNAVTMRNVTPLYLAAANGQEGICEMLLENGAFINLRINSFDNLWAALPYTLESEDVIRTGFDAEDIAKARRHHKIAELLEHYKSVSPDKNFYHSDILEAIKNNNVEEFLDHISEIDHKDLIGWTPLHHATYLGLGYCDIIKACLDNGANVNEEDIFERTPLSIAAGNGNIDILNMLLDSGADVNRGWSIFYATDKNQLLSVKELIAKGADLNLLDPKKCTPLIYAIKKSHSKIAKELLDAGADINLVDEDGFSALHHACLHGQTECVSELIRFGADVNLQNKFQESPLMLAAQTNSINALKMLLENGADINTKDRFRETALHYAVQFSAKECFDELLKHDPDVNSQDEDFSTPLFKTVDDNFEMFKELINHGADFQLTVPGGWTIMHLIAYDGSVEFAQELINKGADINAFSSEKVTPLYIAASRGHLELVKVLIENNCLANVALSELGDEVSLNSSNDALKCETFYLRKVPLKPNYTPVMAAVFNGHLEIVKYLLSSKGDDCNFDISTLKDIAETQSLSEICEYLSSLEDGGEE